MKKILNDVDRVEEMVKAWSNRRKDAAQALDYGVVVRADKGRQSP